jgi:hypothetical protein
MKSCRSVASLSVVAVALLGLSACSGDKPSGLATFTPRVSGSSSSPPPVSTSQWTPEQQQVIDGYDRYSKMVSGLLSKKEKVSLAKARQVATEPYATTFLKDVDATVSAGFVMTGKTVNTISAVTTKGGKATIKTCLDLTRSKLAQPSAPAAKSLPPSRATVSLSRHGDSWLVDGLKAGEGACVSG